MLGMLKSTKQANLVKWSKQRAVLKYEVDSSGGVQRLWQVGYLLGAMAGQWRVLGWGRRK